MIYMERVVTFMFRKAYLQPDCDSFWILKIQGAWRYPFPGVLQRHIDVLRLDGSPHQLPSTKNSSSHGEATRYGHRAALAPK